MCCKLRSIQLELLNLINKRVTGLDIRENLINSLEIVLIVNIKEVWINVRAFQFINVS